MDNTEAQIVIDFNIDDQPRSLCAFIERIAPVYSTLMIPAWHLDLRQCEYLGPDAATIIVATVLESRRLGQGARVTLPKGKPKLAAFCEFCGLNHFLIGTEYPTRDHPENVTVPMRLLKQSNFSDPDPIIKLVREHVNISDETEEYMRTCINEVIQNVQDHAASPIGGVTCARFMTKSNQVRVAIVDRGVGIATTLKRRYPEIRGSKAALEHVVSGGYSAKSRPNNMGVGISNLCGIVVNTFKGEIFIISEDGFADGKAGRMPVSRALSWRYPGTGVFFTIPVQ